MITNLTEALTNQIDEWHDLYYEAKKDLIYCKNDLYKCNLYIDDLEDYVYRLEAKYGRLDDRPGELVQGVEEI